MQAAPGSLAGLPGLPGRRGLVRIPGPRSTFRRILLQHLTQVQLHRQAWSLGAPGMRAWLTAFLGVLRASEVEARPVRARAEATWAASKITGSCFTITKTMAVLLLLCFRLTRSCPVVLLRSSPDLSACRGLLSNQAWRRLHRHRATKPHGGGAAAPSSSTGLRHPVLFFLITASIRFALGAIHRRIGN